MIEVLSVSRLGVSKQARLLDIGCGSGQLLLDLQGLGFSDLTGVDPFIEKDLLFEDGLRVLKKHLADLTGRYDLIMLHHSFEHMDQPAEVMRTIARLLSPKGYVILRVPVAGSLAWRRFGVNWFGLDAPRHLFLHTLQSIEILAKQAGLEVLDVIHETDERMFAACEAYENNLAVTDPGFPRLNLLRLTAWRKARTYRSLAAAANRERMADALCINLRHAERS